MGLTHDSVGFPYRVSHYTNPVKMSSINLFSEGQQSYELGSGSIAAEGSNSENNTRHVQRVLLDSFHDPQERREEKTGNKLNGFVTTTHFKMEGIHSMKELMVRSDWMTHIDLKDAVPIHPDHQQFLRFVWENSTYQFTCLPFGLHLGRSQSS